MAAPKVRDLTALVAEQNKALQPMYQQIDSDIGALETSGRAQEAGLTATKDVAFGQIEQAASDKGMLFSGFSPNEQATYLASTYMPALAEMQATIANARSGLMREKIGLGQKAFDTAFQTREQDVGRRFTYDERIGSQKHQTSERKASQQFQKSERIAGQNFSSKEAEKARQFEARENAATRAAQAAQSAASRAAQPTAAQNMATALTSRVGGDGFVSPGSWQALKNQWVSGGYGSAKSFDSSFGDYRNPKNPHYKLG